jgi:hypothetical protein
MKGTKKGGINIGSVHLGKTQVLNSLGLSKKKSSGKKKAKFTHRQLQDSGVIAESDIGASFHKMLVFKFVEASAGLYEVTAGVKGLSSFTKTIMLEELLEKQQRHVSLLEVTDESAHLKLNINKLIHLLNTEFLQ